MQAQTGNQIIEKLEQNKDKLRELGVHRIGLFGSYARSQQKKKSDIDLLVEYQQGKKTFRNFMGTADFAEELLGAKVDLVTPQSLSPHIAPYVYKETIYVQTA